MNFQVERFSSLRSNRGGQRCLVACLSVPSYLQGLLICRGLPATTGCFCLRSLHRLALLQLSLNSHTKCSLSSFSISSDSPWKSLKRLPSLAPGRIPVPRYSTSLLCRFFLALCMRQWVATSRGPGVSLTSSLRTTRSDSIRCY